MGQFGVSLDREDLIGEARQHRRRIARAGADFEHAVVGRYPRRIDHPGDDVGLRDRLPRRDRQRGVGISEFGEVGGYEKLARHGPHRGEQPRIPDAARGDLARDHRVPAGFGAGGHRPLVRTVGNQRTSRAQAPAFLVIPAPGRPSGDKSWRKSQHRAGETGRAAIDAGIRLGHSDAP